MAFDWLFGPRVQGTLGDRTFGSSYTINATDVADIVDTIASICAQVRVFRGELLSVGPQREPSRHVIDYRTASDGDLRAIYIQGFMTEPSWFTDTDPRRCSRSGSRWNWAMPSRRA